MSKKENHWYLVGATVETLGKAWRPRAWHIGLWLFLVAGFAIAFETGTLEAILRTTNSFAFLPVFTVLLMGLAFGLPWWRRARARQGYVKALQDPGPEKLVALVERSMKAARLLADADAFSAQSRAMAYALYGRGEDAAEALSEVNWAARAPLIQAVGLSAEGIVELLCRRDASHALELNRRARALASISTVLPGAAQTERYHGTCVAVSEVLLKSESSASLKYLDESAADRRFPPLQLLASFGLAVAMDRSGNGARAEQCRAFLREVAPYCTPLHLAPADFSASAREPRPPIAAPVSSSLSSTEAIAETAVQERSAKRKLTRAVGILVGLWALLIVFFFATWALVTPSK